MTRSVEIPDAASDAAHKALAEVGYLVPRHVVPVALVAARPYLMPTEDEISAAIIKAVAEYRGYLVFDGLGFIAAAAVVALLSTSGDGA